MAAKSSEWRPGPTVCRCCLTEGCYKDISTEYFWMGKREVYAEMLKETLEVTISYSKTGGPNSNSRLICEPCISRLRDATEFKRQVVECERVFMQHLDPGSTSLDIEVDSEPMEKIKIEGVKLEKSHSDDEEFGDRHFGDDDDDDDDDLDNQPLTKLASRVPKKESVDLLDLLDTSKPAQKRKSTVKVKPPPSKKAKTKIEAAKAKPSSSKAKPEKKKKEKDANVVARRNAELIVQFSTAYPFRLPENSMVCVYCAESYDDPCVYRQHMDDEHEIFNSRMAFVHCAEGSIKADCTDLRCRICLKKFANLEDTARHLHNDHLEPINLDVDLGIQAFKLEKDKFICAICNSKFLSLRQLSRHTQTHYLKYTCEACGKSYGTLTTLRHHIRFSHITEERICRKCKMTFASLQAKRDHLKQSPKCWPHLCNACGQRFVTWNIKQAHLNEVHGAQKKSYVCPECSKVFADRKKFRFHFKVTHTDDNYMCANCGVKFDTKRGLDEHKVVHTKEKLFPCLVCSKSFPRKKNLVQHMWIHSANKRFECTICNKQFNQRVSWKNHMKAYHPDIYIPPYQSTSTFDETKNNNIKLLFSVLKTD
ncbi:zinc finger and SCAN domain-containing protein 12-like isoform X9 [Plodia interpunctella]|uniref:zinc finger and SCAN domain-containing protein 12-like isoform X9 n=1 Tax=Plodia interpunctella TaxID=58824 RepID=UPI00236795DF|nr:zinc finger and SCAN domain-containing protein 12-like isoform X7 [Plodia interpunctella]